MIFCGSHGACVLVANELVLKWLFLSEFTNLLFSFQRGLINEKFLVGYQVKDGNITMDKSVS